MKTQLKHLENRIADLFSPQQLLIPQLVIECNGEYTDWHGRPVDRVKPDALVAHVVTETETESRSVSGGR